VILLRLGGEEERLKQLLLKTKTIVVYKPVRNDELFRAVLAALHPKSTTAISLAPAITVQKASWPQLQILIAEDNVTNQLIISKLLARLGQRNLTVVSDGQQAVIVCQTSHFDLIFMDVMMPVMDGLEATKRIRALGGGAAQIICAVTANAFQEDQKKYIEAGMNAVITKPIQAIQLERAVDSAVGRRQSNAGTEPAS